MIMYLLTYDYSTNGGSSAEVKEEYLTADSNVDLTNTATKEGWIFVGWNTNKDALVGLESYQMPNSNTTLYAIYSKTLKVTYQKGENIESIGKVEDSCNIYNNNTSCEITLPEITASNGYNVDGWYNGNNKVGNINERYNLNNNLNLISKAIDNIKPTIPTITNSSNGNWTNQNIVVTLKSVDEGSGIDHYEWNNNGVWTSSNITIENNVGTITFNVDNNSNIEFRSVDKAGNISEVSSTPIKRDTVPPTCTSSGESSKWIALTQTIKGTCIDSGSGCKNSQISKTYSIAENITGNYDSSYSPGTVSDNAGNTAVCPNVRVRVTGTTLKDYTSGAVFMYDGKTGLSNTTWQDQSGNNRNGTLVGAVKSGNSVYFDGVNDYVRIGTLSHSQLSLESVIKPTAANKPDVVVLGNFENGGVGLNLSYQTATFKAYKGNNYVYPAFVKINLNGINYIGGSANSSLVKNYINDALSQVNNSSAIVPPRNNEPFLIGANPYMNRLNDEDFYFKGYVYAARMYSKVLTDDQFQKHYVIDKWRFNF